MAAIVSSDFKVDWKPGIAREVMSVDFNDATTATITPSSIKSILSVSVVPTNAAAAAAPAYISSGSIHSASMTLTSATGATFLVTVEGDIA